MRNIEIIQKISLPLNRFHNINGNIIFFSQNHVFRLYNGLLYAAKINPYPLSILFIKIYDNYLHILSKCYFSSDSYYSITSIILDSISLDDMLEYDTNNKNLKTFYRSRLNTCIFDRFEIRDFIVKNNKLAIYANKTYMFQLNFVNKFNLMNIDNTIEPLVNLPEPLKIIDELYISRICVTNTHISKIIGARWNNKSYCLTIANKYNSSVTIFSINIYNDNTFFIIDDHVIICDKDTHIKKHIILNIKGPMLETILEKNMLKFCITNKICIDYEIIYNKDIIICKKDDKYYLITFISTDEPNNIIDYRHYSNITCDQYHIICNNICLKISKFYNSVEEIQAITTVFS